MVTDETIGTVEQKLRSVESYKIKGIIIDLLNMIKDLQDQITELKNQKN